MPNFTTLPPLSLYIHLPWCVKKCPYCDFNSHTFEQALPEKAYIDALIADLEFQLPSIWGRRIISVFIGGGTPSLFSPDSLHRLISTVRSHLNCLPNMEITLEANPGTVEQDKFNGFFAAGINRLSIGVQSFSNAKLQSLGRIHNADEALKAIDIAHKAGFENINLDLMFALPGQTIQQGLDDLQTAISLSPQHISWYQLTIEPNTFFYNHPPVVPDDDTSWDMQQAGQQILADAGFKQYEISAYAKHTHECQHNLNYWQFGDYLAIGAGAHGKISDPGTTHKPGETLESHNGKITRYWQLRQPADYMNAAAHEKTSASEIIQNDELVFEFMLNALRLKQGFDIALFEQHTGLMRQSIQLKCQQAIDKGLLQQQGDVFSATHQGYLFLNDLINHFAKR